MGLIRGKSVCFFAVLIFLHLCISAEAWPTRKGLEKILDSWMSRSSDDLVASWGVPESSYSFASGGKVISYTLNSASGISAIPIGNSYSVINRNWYCKVTFRVGLTNRIQNWSYEGNNCRASAPKN